MAARRTTRSTDHSADTVRSRLAGRVAAVLPPPLLWAAAILVAGLVRKLLPADGQAQALTAAGGAALAALAWHLTHQRSSAVARVLAPATIAAAAGWVMWVDGAGLHARSTVMWWLIPGGMLTFGWCMWLHVHHAGEAGGVARWFTAAAAHTAHPGLRMRITKLRPAMIVGKLRHPPGVTTEHVLKEVGSLESAGELPPGAIKVTADPKNARLSDIKVVNPLVLDKPQLWPGPSAQGTSIAHPLVLGKFADGTPWPISPFHPDLPGFQLLVMGITGAAKTTGLGYSFLGDTFTRRDVAVCAIDTSKGDQFMGPLKPALHHLAQDEEAARRLLWRIHGARRPRTDYLATQGLDKWQEGCGLSALVLWIEEASRVFRLLGDAAVENWVLPMVLEARSAGIFVVISLQRADWTQLPTTVRAQLGSICMGVRDAGDAAFGLSDEQADHGCQPGRWKNEKPGMAYCDYPGLPGEEYKYMESRTWWWGKGTAMMAAHAARFPATSRPLDQLTATYLDAPAPPAAPPVVASARRRAATQPPQETAVTEPPTDAELESAEPAEPTGYDEPGLWDPDPDEAGDPPTGADMDPDGGEHRFGGDPPPAVARLPMTPQASLSALEDMITALYETGVGEVTIGEHLADAPTRCGRSRTWLYPALRQLAAEGMLEEREHPTRWAVVGERRRTA